MIRRCADTFCSLNTLHGLRVRFHEQRKWDGLDALPRRDLQWLWSVIAQLCIKSRDRQRRKFLPIDDVASLSGGEVVSGFCDDLVDSNGDAALTVAFVGGFHETEQFNCF